MEYNPLGSMVNRKIGYGIVQPGQSVPDGVPVIKVNNLISGLKSPSELDTTARENEAKYSRTRLHGGELIVSVVGTIGKTAIVPKSFAGCNLVRATALIDIEDELMSKWVKYYFDSPCGQSYIEQNLNTTVQPTLNIKSLVEMPIPIRDTTEMEKTVLLLSALDEKIEVNRQINDNLQQQAQAIYSSMFIDNPDPAWSHGHLSDLITVKYGKDHKKLADGIYPVYGSGGIMRYVERPLYNKESVLIPRKGTLNNVMYVNQPFWSVDTMFYTEMKLPNVAKFVYHFVKAKDLASMNAGSAVPSMTTDILNAMEVVIPSASALEEFESLVAPMYEAMEANDVQSKALSQMRDTLLPKLMSGKIDVSSVQL